MPKLPMLGAMTYGSLLLEGTGLHWTEEIYNQWIDVRDMRSLIQRSVSLLEVDTPLSREYEAGSIPVLTANLYEE